MFGCNGGECSGLDVMAVSVQVWVIMAVSAEIWMS